MRRSLKHNATTRAPARHVFLDTETRTDLGPLDQPTSLQMFRLGVARSVRLEHGQQRSASQLRFQDLDDWWEWLEGRLSVKEPTWIWAHNLGFDSTVIRLWERIIAGDYRLRGRYTIRDRKNPGQTKQVDWKGYLVTADPPTIYCLRHRSGAITKWVDTLNWWRTSLEVIGQSFGLDKVPLPAWDAPEADWWARCERDCEILQTAVLALVSYVLDNDLGVFQTTAPGQAMNAFRHRFMSHNLVYHDQPEAKELERESYFGGENVLYFKGQIRPEADWFQSQAQGRGGAAIAVMPGPVHVLDVRSSYPSVMRSNWFPCRLEEIRVEPSIDDAKLLLQPWHGIAHVTLATESHSYPQRDREGVSYALGHFQTALAGPELDLALERGHVRKIHRLNLYSCEPIFTAYVDWFWQQRTWFHEAGNVAGEFLAKLFLLGLYGKFGQLTGDWINRPDLCARQLWGQYYDRDPSSQEILELRSVGLWVQEHKVRVEHEKAMPAICAFVTAYQRVEMARLRAIAGPANVYYQLVDCLHVSTQGRANLVAAGELADWQLGKLHDKGVYQAADYITTNTFKLDGTLCAAGRKRSAKEEGGHTTQMKFERLNSVLATAPPLPGIRVWREDWQMPEDHLRGRVRQDGWIDPPFIDAAEGADYLERRSERLRRLRERRE